MSAFDDKTIDKIYDTIDPWGDFRQPAPISSPRLHAFDVADGEMVLSEHDDLHDASSDGKWIAAEEPVTVEQ